MTIESEEFYNLCQRYRFASIGNQDEVSAAYQDLIKFIDDKAKKSQVEPVAYVSIIDDDKDTSDIISTTLPVHTQLFTSSPQREWIELTNEQMEELSSAVYEQGGGDVELIQMTEAKLRELNTR